MFDDDHSDTENNNRPTTTKQSRTFLWSVPRSASTTFLKSISRTEDGIFWHEPLTQVIKFGTTKSSRRLASKEQKNGTGIPKPIKSLGKETSGGGFLFDANKVSLAWLKCKLERTPHKEKQIVFVKELIDGIIDPDGLEDYLEWIPDGYRHTFLIRHPYRVCASFVKLYKETKSKKSRTDLKHQIPGRLQCYSKMCNLLEYIKENHDRKPIIVDTDDLLLNPVGLMQAYCKDISIPYTSSLLHWDAGDEIMKTKWCVAKQVIRSHQTSKMYTSTFTSTGFENLRVCLADQIFHRNYCLSLTDRCPFMSSFMSKALNATSLHL
ncbi:uncharacterized protein [Amphiura filiformis]|uniref:uncharacterized protein n=1 Tax=Amphiura filiformis TaxID=82378 RepID=UPI003B214272